MRSPILAALLLAALSPLSAQSPIPVLVPANSSAAAASTTTTSAPQAAEAAPSLSSVVKMLEELKAANEETLKKQEATLAQLDELEKAAEQIRIYTKRG